MYTRGHRGFAAALVLLALVLSAVAFLPSTARAQSNQITGLVYVCGGPTSVVVSGAQVVLSDANGVLVPLSTTSGTDGTFVFTPPTSNYTISVSKSGYYSNNTPSNIASPFRFDGSLTVPVNVCLDAQPTGTNVVTFHVQNGAGAPIGGATVAAYNPARLSTPWSALIFSNVTNATTGNSVAGLWSGTFEIRVNAAGYGPFVEPMAISSSGTITIPMQTEISVTGHAKNQAGQFVSAGLVGWLYNATRSTFNGTKVIKAVVTGSLFSFNAPAGDYTMVIAANGYATFEAPLHLVSGTVSQDATLLPAAREQYLTTVLFGPRDWNNLTVYRNWTLNAYSTLPGLGPAGLRDLRLQISYSLGNGQGTVGATEATKFTDWLQGNGPLYVTTDSFFLLNGKSFNSSVTSYTVVVTDLTTPGAKVSINTVTTYHLKSTAWIVYGQPKYFLNMTLYPDTNTTVYHNETYVVQLPRAYEMASNTILPSTSPPAIVTSGFTRITLDPGIVGTGITPQIRMILQKSLNGTARAKVTGPTGKFSVVNASYQNYRAFVAENTNLTFSAQESTDPVGDIAKANFTWRFESNVTTTQFLGYGITPTFKYTSMGEYVVNLTVVQAGGNITFRNILLWVDGTLPHADFRTNRTGSGSANGTSRQFDQGTTVRFDGSLSTDQAFPGKTGTIANAGYSWDFNGDRIADATGRVVNWTFTKPGQFKVNLTVTDGVGWKGVNATMTVTVNDTQAPVPAFSILDPASDYAPTTSLMEGRNYTFNASTTTDNYDKLANLKFNWTIPGPIYGAQGTTHSFTGMNITIGWSSWNSSYQVELAVTDTGFGSGKPNTGYKFTNLTVQVDWTRHPDLFIVTGTPKIDNANPESGATVTITLNVTNKANRGPASAVYVTVREGTGSGAVTLSPTWQMYDKSGSVITPQVIASGATVTMKISVAVTGQGNKTLTVTVADQNEPYTVKTAENSATLSVIVNQPAWVNIAIAAAIIGLFAVVIFAMYYRRKVKAGDWEPRFRRSKGEKEEGGKERPRREKEAKEEKKRL